MYASLLTLGIVLGAAITSPIQKAAITARKFVSSWVVILCDSSQSSGPHTLSKFRVRYYSALLCNAEGVKLLFCDCILYVLALFQLNGQSPQTPTPTLTSTSCSLSLKYILFFSFLF